MLNMQHAERSVARTLHDPVQSPPTQTQHADRLSQVGATTAPVNFGYRRISVPIGIAKRPQMNAKAHAFPQTPRSIIETNTVETIPVMYVH